MQSSLISTYILLPASKAYLITCYFEWTGHFEQTSYIQQIWFSFFSIFNHRENRQNLYNTKIACGWSQYWQCGEIRGRGEVQECRNGRITWKVGSYHQKTKYRLVAWTERHWKTWVYSFINALFKFVFLHTYPDSDVLTGCRNPLTYGMPIENKSNKTMCCTFNF